MDDLDRLVLLAEGVRQAAEDDDDEMANDLFDQITSLVAKLHAKSLSDGLPYD